MRALFRVLFALPLAGAVVACGGESNPVKDIAAEVPAAVDDCAALETDAGVPVCLADADCAGDDFSCIGVSDIVTVAKANPHATHPATLSLAFKQLQLNKSDKAKST
ncbi:MAG: hypothetical protein D6761_03840, partial [Candidatus Dadabacteria bacterium]